jgi:hypothetical protein
MMSWRVSLSAIGVSCLLSGSALAEDLFVKLGDLRIYSDFSFNIEEREFNGQQIMIIPSYNGKKVLWRMAEGAAFDPPLLLDAVEQGNVLKVTVPTSVIWNGEWTLETKGAMLQVKGPKGVSYNLKQTPLR